VGGGDGSTQGRQSQGAAAAAVGGGGSGDRARRRRRPGGAAAAERGGGGSGRRRRPYTSTCAAHTRTHKWAQHTPGHINGRSTHPDTSMGAHKSTRKNPPAGGRTGVEAPHGGHQPRRVANQTMQTVTRRSSVVPPVQSRCCNQPRLQRLDSQSGSDRAAPGCTHDARLS